MQRTPTFIIVLILVGAAAFYGGMRYEQSRGSQGVDRSDTQNLRNFSPEERQQRRAQFGGGSGRSGGRQGDVAAGEIIARDATSITVKLRDGGSKIVLLSGTTEIGKTAAGTTADLAVGTTVFVSGSANSDGSLTAQSIQIRPQGGDRPTP